MNTLRNKKYNSFDYLSRYTGVPYYYDTLADREVFGLSTNLKKNTSWAAHKINQEDTLESLALKYYNNPTYWWIIAFFNDIQDPFMRLSDYYTAIKIPSMNGIAFGNER